MLRQCAQTGRPSQCSSNKAVSLYYVVSRALQLALETTPRVFVIRNTPIASPLLPSPIRYPTPTFARQQKKNFHESRATNLNLPLRLSRVRHTHTLTHTSMIVDKLHPHLLLQCAGLGKRHFRYGRFFDSGIVPHRIETMAGQCSRKAMQFCNVLLGNQLTPPHLILAK